MREILVLHHSHLDIGCTHSQPVAMEMPDRYFELRADSPVIAIDLELNQQIHPDPERKSPEA